MLPASFGGKWKSSYGNIVTGIQMMGENAKLESATAILLQEFENRWASIGNNGGQLPDNNRGATLAHSENRHWQRFRGNYPSK